jgi:hypothetical protein
MPSWTDSRFCSPSVVKDSVEVNSLWISYTIPGNFSNVEKFPDSLTLSGVPFCPRSTEISICGIRWVRLCHKRKLFRCWKIPRFAYLIRCPFLFTFNRHINLWLILGDPNYAIRGKFSNVEKFPDLLSLSCVSFSPGLADAWICGIISRWSRKGELTGGFPKLLFEMPSQTDSWFCAPSVV